MSQPEFESKAGFESCPDCHVANMQCPWCRSVRAEQKRCSQHQSPDKKVFFRIVTYREDFEHGCKAAAKACKQAEEQKTLEQYVREGDRQWPQGSYWSPDTSDDEDDNLRGRAEKISLANVKRSLPRLRKGRSQEPEASEAPGQANCPPKRACGDCYAAE